MIVFAAFLLIFSHLKCHYNVKLIILAMSNQSFDYKNLLYCIKQL